MYKKFILILLGTFYSVPNDKACRNMCLCFYHKRKVFIVKQYGGAMYLRRDLGIVACSTQNAVF